MKKICPRCSKTKDYCEFNKHNKSKDKLQGICRECAKIAKSSWATENKKHIQIYNHEHYEENTEYHSERNKTWMKNNKAKRAKYSYTYTKNRLKSDINYKIAHSLRRRLRNALNNNQKVGSAINDLGCSVQELKQYLENKFYAHPITGEKMSWNNNSHKGWHIDHIKPLISFDLTDRKQFLEACHYTNLQPLWSEENWKKGKKYE